jgi:hypothetical protein
MPVNNYEQEITLVGECTAEEADLLLGYLLEQPDKKVNLKDCEHMHCSLMQVLMAANANINMPSNERLAWLLKSALAIKS